MTLILLNLLKLVLRPRIWYILINVLDTLEKHVHFTVSGVVAWVEYFTNVSTSWLVGLSKSTTLLLTFCLLVEIDLFLSV